MVNVLKTRSDKIKCILKLFLSLQRRKYIKLTFAKLVTSLRTGQLRAGLTFNLSNLCLFHKKALKSVNFSDPLSFYINSKSLVTVSPYCTLLSKNLTNSLTVC